MFTELELKFRADNIKLTDFEALVESLPYNKKKLASSWDYYLVKEGSPDEFQRYRESDKPELTKKVKTVSGNNLNRVEVDLPLDADRISYKLVEFYVGLEGYKFNFKIFKSCTIYWFENINMVHYSAFDANMNKLGSFVEIEYEKSKVAEVGEAKAIEELKEWEKKLGQLGITPQNRLRKSLFELYRK